MTCDQFSESRRRLLLAVGGGICAPVADTNAAAAETPEDRLRALLSDRRSLRLLRGDQYLEATYWTINAGYNRDEYLGVDAPLRIHSGYRTPKTNRLTEGSVLDSRHIVGRAADISVPGVSNVRLAGMASVLGRGGTGLYPGRNFVHVDTGDERIWIDRPRKKV
jgi:uncharacterized protein YcbK (DUF882 family)